MKFRKELRGYYSMKQKKDIEEQKEWNDSDLSEIK